MAPRVGGLSNGTLSLKFMQRAQISANEAPVEATRAKLVNESEWELPVARVGRAGSFKDSESVVTYEASYLPFLFDRTAKAEEDASEDEDDVPAPGRRRLFANGKEKTFREPDPPIQQPLNTEMETSTSAPPPRETIAQSGPPPRSISRSVQRKTQDSEPSSAPPAPVPSTFMRPPVDAPSTTPLFSRPPVDAPAVKVNAIPSSPPKSSREALGDLIAGARRAAAQSRATTATSSQQVTPAATAPTLVDNGKKKRVRADSGPGGDASDVKPKKKKKKKAAVDTNVAE